MSTLVCFRYRILLYVRNRLKELLFLIHIHVMIFKIRKHTPVIFLKKTSQPMDKRLGTDCHDNQIFIQTLVKTLLQVFDDSITWFSLYGMSQSELISVARDLHSANFRRQFVRGLLTQGIVKNVPNKERLGWNFVENCGRISVKHSGMWTVYFPGTSHTEFWLWTSNEYCFTQEVIFDARKG